MLIGTVSAVSICLSALLCLLTNAFDSLMWLWLLPVGFAGGFLLLSALWFALLYCMAKAVDMEKEVRQDSPFYRWVITLTINALVTLLRIRVDSEGLSKIPKDGRFLLVCNHLHDTDPLILLRAFPKSQLAFISKRENDVKFIVGPFLRRILCQPINRENDREALKTILKCISLLKEDTVSIGVFPEGYCSKDHLLHPFRGGVFKIAQKANVPIVVCTIQGTYTIFRNMKTLTPSHVKLHLVDVIPAEALAGRTAVDIAQQVHTIMANDLGPELVLQEEE